MFTLIKQEERRGYLKTKQVIEQIKKKNDKNKGYEQGIYVWLYIVQFGRCLIYSNYH